MSAELETTELVKAIAPVIKTAVDEATAKSELNTTESLKAFEKTLAEIELKSKKIAQDSTVTEKQKQEIMVKTFREVALNGSSSESAFKGILEANCKATFNNTNIAGEGLETVFTQFENDILRVIKEYDLLKEVRIINIKGNELKIPKGLNNVTTAYTAEGATIVASKAGTAFITINTYKMASLVTLTEELLKDNMIVPDFYAMLVSMIGESQAEFLENELLNGTDATKVEGILVNSDVNVQVAGAGDTVLADMAFADVDNLISNAETQILREFQKQGSNAIAIMSKYVFNILKGQKVTTGEFAYPEMRGANPVLDQKFRVVLSDKAPMQNAAADVAGATILVMGELKTYYALVMADKMTVTRGLATGDFEDDLQSVKARKRAGGKLTFGEALVKINTAAV